MMAGAPPFFPSRTISLKRIAPAFGLCHLPADTARTLPSGV